MTNLIETIHWANGQLARLARAQRRESKRLGKVAHRGRPAKNGRKHPAYLFRAVPALSAYDRARQRGEKYEAALLEAVAAARKTFPEMRMSKTQTKSLLADLRPKSSETTIFFENEVDREQQKQWTIRIGCNPKYPRHNSREPQV